MLSALDATGGLCVGGFYDVPPNPLPLPCRSSGASPGTGMGGFHS